MDVVNEEYAELLHVSVGILGIVIPNRETQGQSSPQSQASGSLPPVYTSSLQTPPGSEQQISGRCAESLLH